jgi:hypothetical protein
MEANMTFEAGFQKATASDFAPRTQVSHAPSDIRSDPLRWLPPAANAFNLVIISSPYSSPHPSRVNTSYVQTRNVDIPADRSFLARIAVGLRCSQQ